MKVDTGFDPAEGKVIITVQTPLLERYIGVFQTFLEKSKRAVIEYIEPSEKYLNRRKGTIADILMPEASTFTNQIKIDDSLVSKKALLRPEYIIKFGKEKDRMFTIWNGNIIAPYNNEKCMTIAMAPYLDEVYNLERKNNIFTLFNTRNFKNI